MALSVSRPLLTWLIVCVLLTTAYLTLTSRTNFNLQFPLKSVEASDVKIKSTIDFPKLIQKYFSEEDTLKEIGEQLINVLSHADIETKASISHFLVLLNSEPEWDNVLTFLSKNGFPDFEKLTKMDLLASLLETVASIPSFSDDPEKFKKEVDILAKLCASHLNIHSLLTSFIENLDKDQHLQEILKYFQTRPVIEAFDRLGKEPSASTLIPIFYYSIGLFDSSMTSFKSEISPLIEQLTGHGIQLDLPENNERTRLAWMYNPDQDRSFLMDVDAKNPRPDVYIMQSLKFWRALKTAGYEHVIQLAVSSSYFQNSEQVKMYEKLSQILTQVRSLPERPIPLPGNRPPRPLSQIEEQIGGLEGNKKRLDELKQISESTAGEILGRTYIGNLSIPYTMLLFEAEGVQVELLVNKYKGGEEAEGKLERIIEDLKKIDGVSTEGHTVTKLEHLFIDLVNMDYEGLLIGLPRFAEILGNVKQYLDRKGYPVFQLLAGFINAEVTVDNVLSYLTYNGFPGLKDKDKLEILTDVLDYLPPFDNEKNFEDPEVVEGLVMRVRWMVEAFFYLVDSNNFLPKYIKFQSNNLTFRKFLRFLGSDEVRTGYRRIVDNLRGSEILMDDILYTLLGMNANHPSEFGTFLNTVETLLNWGHYSGDAQDSWQYNLETNDVDLVLLKEGQDKMELYRSILVKLERDLKSLVGNIESVHSNSRQFLDQVTAFTEVGRLEEIRTLPLTTTTTTNQKVKEQKSEL